MERGCKRGQVTVFVIIAILIVVAALLMMYWNDISDALNLGYPAQAQPVHDEIQNCVTQTAKDAIQIISMQGGYVSPASFYVQTPYRVAYWLNKSGDVSPSLNTVARELEWVMNYLLPACVYSINFSKYSIENFTDGLVSSRAAIGDEVVVFDVTYSISIDIADKSYTFRRFSDRENVRLGKIYKIARQIVSQQLKDGGEICMSCISDISFQNDIFIQLDSLQGESIVPNIIDNKSEIFKPENYTFSFAMKIK